MVKKTIYIRASYLKSAACLRKLHWLLMGYRSSLNNQKAEFGTAFHITPKLIASKDDIIAAILASRNYYETKAKYEVEAKHLTSTYLSKVCMDWYDESYKKDNFTTLIDNEGNPLVEIQARMSIYNSNSLEVILCGTLDRICYHNTSNLICVADYKTTGAWDKYNYLRSYKLSSQLYCYRKMLKHYIDTSSPNSILYEYKTKDVGCFIDGVFLNSKQETYFERSEVMVYNEKQVEEFDQMLFSLCKRLDEFYINQETTIQSLPYREGLLTGQCNGGFKPCTFTDACSSSDDIALSFILEKNFIIKPYEETLGEQDD